MRVWLCGLFGHPLFTEVEASSASGHMVFERWGVRCKCGYREGYLYSEKCIFDAGAFRSSFAEVACEATREASRELTIHGWSPSPLYTRAGYFSNLDAA